MTKGSKPKKASKVAIKPTVEKSKPPHTKGKGKSKAVQDEAKHEAKLGTSKRNEGMAVKADIKRAATKESKSQVSRKEVGKDASKKGAAKKDAAREKVKPSSSKADDAEKKQAQTELKKVIKDPPPAKKRKAEIEGATGKKMVSSKKKSKKEVCSVFIPSVAYALRQDHDDGDDHDSRDPRFKVCTAIIHVSGHHPTAL